MPETAEAVLLTPSTLACIEPLVLDVSRQLILIFPAGDVRIPDSDIVKLPSPANTGTCDEATTVVPSHSLHLMRSTPDAADVCNVTVPLANHVPVVPWAML